MPQNQPKRLDYRPELDALREWVIQIGLLTVIVAVPVALTALVSQIVLVLMT